MKNLFPQGVSKLRMRFVLVAVLFNGALMFWALLPSRRTSPPIENEQASGKRRDRHVHAFKKQIHTNLSKESVEQSIEHLTNFDDSVPNLMTLGNNVVGEHQYLYAVRYYPALNRVRKILEEAKDDPSHVSPILKEKLSHALDDYKRIVKAYWDRVDSGKLPTSVWDEYEKRRISISCSVYLLAQLGASDSLPLMAKLFIDQGNTDKLFTKGDWKAPFYPDANGVVNQLFLFCAMHHLVRNHPRAALSPQALKRMDEYLEASTDIPVFEEVSVPCWHAKYEVWDYRITILRQDLEMDKQPHIRVHLFPEQMRFQEERFLAIPTLQVRKWFTKMKLFIDAAYPAEATPAAKTKGGAS